MGARRGPCVRFAPTSITTTRTGWIRQALLVSSSWLGVRIRAAAASEMIAGLNGARRRRGVRSAHHRRVHAPPRRCRRVSFGARETSPCAMSVFPTPVGILGIVTSVTAVARWVAVPARPRRRCPRAAAGQGRGGGGYRQRAGGSVLRDRPGAGGPWTRLGRRWLAFRAVGTYHPDANPDENAAARFRRSTPRTRSSATSSAPEVRPGTGLGGAPPNRSSRGKNKSRSHPSSQEPNLSTHSVPRRRPWTRDGARGGRAATRATRRPEPARSQGPPRRTRGRRRAERRARRKEGMTGIQTRFRRCWDVWCRLWMAGLNVGVPVASAYFVAVGLMHERLPLFR